ncbi:hypothetical protein [Haloquadratum walsbyi]|uniref:hypothetical protein n=1 Tax=Haloquadratum walsbyi TaxID=293091 RepID=UPI0000DA0219|nr:hypothetical protein [Haloquadratum walsbyi]
MQRPRYEPNQHLLGVVFVSLLWSVRQHPILPLFLTYTQGENRIPSTVIGVLAYINHQLAEDILEALTDEPACFQLLLSNRDHRISPGCTGPLRRGD